MKSRNYKKGLKVMTHIISMKKNAMLGVIFTRTPICYNKHGVTEWDEKGILGSKGRLPQIIA
jgi:hypothetical protein